MADMSQTIEDIELEARVADLASRVLRPSVPQCERCGLTLVRGVPKTVNSVAEIRNTGRYYQGCSRPGCRYTGGL